MLTHYLRIEEIANVRINLSIKELLTEKVESEKY